MNSSNNSPFVNVSYTERDNFINNLSSSDLYKYKIAFVEGNGDDIPHSIWTHGKSFANVNTNSNSNTNNQISQQTINNIKESIISYIKSNYLDTNSNNIPDWEEYTIDWENYNGTN